MERDETKKIAGGMAELPDEELNEVVGGKDVHDEFVGQKKGGLTRINVYKRYKWEGGDINLKYRCPNCGRLVHKGAAGRFYCDPCNESWFVESLLVPNLDAWVFKYMRECQACGSLESE